MSAPLSFRFDGFQMLPLDVDSCRRLYQPGKTYRLIEAADRTGRSHRHYFACVREAWQNLPEDQAKRFPTAEHLRKWALIRTGYNSRREVVCASHEDATNLVAMIDSLDEFGISNLSGVVVTVWTPASQSTRAMGREVFEASKRQVLEYLASMIGVTVDELSAQGAKGET